MSTPLLSRRTLLAALPGVAVGALAGPRLSRALQHPLRVAPEPLQILAERPLDLETPLSALALAFTPNDLFFVRSHHGPPPRERPYRLTLDGLARAPLGLTLAELRTFPKVTLPAVLQCAGNGRAFFEPRVPGAQWKRGAAGQALWGGARVCDVLARAGVEPTARFVRCAGADRPPLPSTPAFVRSLPLARALDPTTLLAYEMNGEPLPHLHGAPVRLVVPGWSGDDWIKWLDHLSLSADEDPGFYMSKGYKLPDESARSGEPAKASRRITTMPVKSILALPAEGAAIRVGKHRAVGVAWSGTARVARVELSSDGGASFREAALDGPDAPGAWRVWTADFEARAPGPLVLLARASDAAGETQPERTPPNPGGYLWNGIERRELTVIA